VFTGDGLPVPGRDSPIDAVDDFFRIRLVCTLLDTCGACFDRGSQKRKLDHFLVIFQVGCIDPDGIIVPDDPDGWTALCCVQERDANGRRLHAE
jgi:hypothetical protein